MIETPLGKGKSLRSEYLSYYMTNDNKQCEYVTSKYNFKKRFEKYADAWKQLSLITGEKKTKHKNKIT